MPQQHPAACVARTSCALLRTTTGLRSWPQGYDKTIVALVVIAIALGLGFLAGLVGLLVFHVLPPLYARPLNFQVDVERKYRQ